MNGHAVSTILLAAAAWAGLIALGYLARWLHRRPSAKAPAPPPPPAVIHADITQLPAFDRSYQIGPAPDREGGEET